MSMAKDQSLEDQIVYDDSEPDSTWKDTLTIKIEENMLAMMTEAGERLEHGLSNGSITDEEKEARNREYVEELQAIRALAKDTYEAQLELERQERRRATASILQLPQERPPQPARTFNPKVEPEDSWKDALKMKIEESRLSMVEQAKAELQGVLGDKSAPKEKREMAKKHFSLALQNIKHLAEKTFKSELERERQERRWATGQEMGRHWNVALEEEQRGIIEKIKDVQDASWPPRYTQEQGSRTASQPEDERNRGTQLSTALASNWRSRFLSLDSVTKIWKPSTARRVISGITGQSKALSNHPTAPDSSCSQAKPLTPEQNPNNGRHVQIGDMPQGPPMQRQPDLTAEATQFPHLQPHTWNGSLDVVDRYRESDCSRPTISIMGSQSEHDVGPHQRLQALSSNDTMQLKVTASEDDTRQSSQNPINETMQDDNQGPVAAPLSKDPKTPEKVGASVEEDEDDQKKEAPSITAENSEATQLGGTESPVDTANATMWEAAGTQQQMPPVESLSISPELGTLSKLAAVFKDVDLYRQFLSCTKTDAQTILDVFQLVLDTRSFLDYRRRQLITAMRRLSETTQLYPLCFNLQGPVQVIDDQATKSGSYADIHRAQFKDEHLCLKVIRAYKTSLVEHMGKVYAREAILWGQLSHPNLLPFYGLYLFRSQISFVSPWAENGHLGDYLEVNPGSNRVLLCSDTAAGLCYLHENTVVHGDLKAANVIVDGSGRACLADFGLSSVTDPLILHWATHSSVASKGGSIRWQAPELHVPEMDNAPTEKIVHNSKESDVFAWACLCYEVFTGRLPFFESTRESTVILRISRGDHPTRPPEGTLPWTEHGLTTSIWDVMKDCWNFRPQERPDISTIISQLGTGLPADDRPPSQWHGRSAMRFRNLQHAGSEHNYHTLEDLNAILSQLLSK